MENALKKKKCCNTFFRAPLPFKRTKTLLELALLGTSYLRAATYLKVKTLAKADKNYYKLGYKSAFCLDCKKYLYFTV